MLLLQIRTFQVLLRLSLMLLLAPLSKGSYSYSYSYYDDTATSSPTDNPTSSPTSSGSDIYSYEYAEYVEDESGHITNLMVVRPFAVNDSILESFEDWEHYSPCAMDSTNTNYDLALVFSRNIEDFPLLSAALEEEVRNSTWQHCFNEIHIVSANLSVAEDVYVPHQSQNNSRWVTGPNLQFLFISELFQNLSDYDSWFLMEIDSQPLKDLWLDHLVSVANQHVPFAILGSNFRGNLWDGFIDELDFALQWHVNGNAIYNSSHNLMKYLHRQLTNEMENGLRSSTTAFDYRMAEIVFNDGSNPPGFDFLSNFSFNGEMPYINDFVPLSNYAKTPMIKEFYGDEILAHGSIMYEKWNTSQNSSIGLLISDFATSPTDTNNFEVMLASITNHSHPYSEVVFVRPNGTLSDPSNYTVTGVHGDIKVREIVRTGRASADDMYYPDFLDWCDADISTDWFMVSNTFHKLADPVFILQTSEGKPYVPYVQTNSDGCRDHPECIYSVIQANNFSDYLNVNNTGATLDYHVLDKEMVFLNSFHGNSVKTNFCNRWNDWHNISAIDGACDPISGPTADDYIVFTKDLQMLHLQDKYKTGAVLNMLRHAIPDVESQTECSIFTTELNISTTSCMMQTQEDTCNVTQGCYWRAHFSRCFDYEGQGAMALYRNLSVPIQSPPTASPTVSPTSSPTSSPTTSPTASPTASPTTSPIEGTAVPTFVPTLAPTTKYTSVDVDFCVTLSSNDSSNLTTTTLTMAQALEDALEVYVELSGTDTTNVTISLISIETTSACSSSSRRALYIHAQENLMGGLYPFYPRELSQVNASDNSTYNSTAAPSTIAPSTLAPSTMAPSTLAPSTMAPSTQAPTLAPTIAHTGMTSAPSPTLTTGSPTLSSISTGSPTSSPVVVIPTTPAPTVTTSVTVSYTFDFEITGAVTNKVAANITTTVETSVADGSLSETIEEETGITVEEVSLEESTLAPTRVPTASPTLAPTASPTSSPTTPAPTVASCDDSCDSHVSYCWCDHSCVTHGDCCSDVCEFCGYCNITESHTANSTTYEASLSVSLSGVNASDLTTEVLANLTSSFAEELGVDEDQVTLTVSSRRELRQRFPRSLSSASISVIISGLSSSKTSSVKSSLTSTTTLASIFSSAGVSTSSISLSSLYVLLSSTSAPTSSYTVPPTDGTVPPTGAPIETAAPKLIVTQKDVSQASKLTAVNTALFISGLCSMMTLLRF